MSINKIIILGNCGKDPDIRKAGDTTAASFSVATSERYTDRNSNQVENTEWHSVNCFGKSAEYAQKYIRKGARVYVEGSLRTRSYQTSDGQTKYVTEIRADRIECLDYPKDNSGDMPASVYNGSGKPSL